MTVAELIERLRELDPEGTKDVTVQVHGEGCHTYFEIEAPRGENFIILSADE